MTTFEQEKQQAIEIAKSENGYTQEDKGDYVAWLFDSMRYFKEQIANGCTSADNLQRLGELKELYHTYLANL